MFQLRPNSVRSMTVSSCRCARVLPNASGDGGAQVPVAVTGCVTPRIVRSPVALAVPSSARSRSVETNVTVGLFSTSKKSALRTWARNCSGVRIEIDSTCAVPSSLPSTSVAATSSSVPRKSETFWYLTAKPKLEWTGSALNVPARAVAVLMKGVLQGRSSVC